VSEGNGAVEVLPTRIQIDKTKVLIVQERGSMRQQHLRQFPTLTIFLTRPSTLGLLVQGTCFGTDPTKWLIERSGTSELKRYTRRRNQGDRKRPGRGAANCVRWDKLFGDESVRERIGRRSDDQGAVGRVPASLCGLQPMLL
jgi:hypothetical protein